MYRQDLSPIYDAKLLIDGHDLLSVGWLSNSYSFSKGEVSDCFLSNLWAFCRVPVRRMRGLHGCHLCDKPLNERIIHNGESILLGSAEIRVPADNNVIYAAPNLIFHYIRDHQYLPPKAFVEAVETVEIPLPEDYFQLLEETENLSSHWRKMPNNFVRRVE